MSKTFNFLILLLFVAFTINAQETTIYDGQGNAVGARDGATNMITSIEPIKSIQEISPIRPITPITPIKPIFSNSWSSESLTEFLYSGKN
jgi:hypothetical protein